MVGGRRPEYGKGKRVLIDYDSSEFGIPSIDDGPTAVRSGGVLTAPLR